MYLLLTFIIIWAISPGPVLVMTVHESRKHGSMAGVALSAGATLTAAVMVGAGVLVHNAGFSNFLESGNLSFIEQIGAVLIISLGIYAAYKGVFAKHETDTSYDGRANNKIRFGQGVMVMATYFPQALIFYNILIPQTVAPAEVFTTILALGALKSLLIFGWHAGAAMLVGRAQNLVTNQRVSRVFELASAGLIVAMGVNLLI